RRFWRPVLYQLSYCPSGGSLSGEDISFADLLTRGNPPQDHMVRFGLRPSLTARLLVPRDGGRAVGRDPTPAALRTLAATYPYGLESSQTAFRTRDRTGVL